MNVQHIKHARKPAIKTGFVKNSPSTTTPTTVMIELVDNAYSHSKSSHSEHRPEDNIRDIYDVIQDVVEDETAKIVGTTESEDINADKTLKRNAEEEDVESDNNDMETANTHGLGYYKETEWVYPQNYAYDGLNGDGYNNYNNYNFNGHVAYDQNGYAASGQAIPYDALGNYGYYIKPCHKLFGCKFSKWFW